MRSSKVNMSVKYPLLGSKPLDRCLEEAEVSGNLNLSGRNLRNLACCDEYDISDVTEADLSRNRFIEIPSELCACASLESLVCHHNVLKAIPDEIGQLKRLTHLDCSRNQLFSIPSSLCSLELETLILKSNRLTVLPPEVGSLKRLLELDVGNNELRHLPQTIGDMDRLRTLKLRRNCLVDLPDSLWKLKLTHLDLTSNHLKALPLSLTKLSSSILILGVDSNPLESPPSEVCSRGLFHILKYLMRKNEELTKPQRSNSARRSRTGEFRHSKKHESSQGGTLSTVRNSVSLTAEIASVEKKIAEKHGLEWWKLSDGATPDNDGTEATVEVHIPEPTVSRTIRSAAVTVSSSVPAPSQPTAPASSSVSTTETAVMRSPPRTRAYATLPSMRVANGGSRVTSNDKKNDVDSLAVIPRMSQVLDSKATHRLSATQMARSLHRKATGKSSPTKRDSPTSKGDSTTAFDFDKRKSLPVTTTSSATDGPIESVPKERSTNGQDGMRKSRVKGKIQNKPIKRRPTEAAKETSPSDAEEREKARENEQRVMETRIAWENREKATLNPPPSLAQRHSESTIPAGTKSSGSLKHKPSDPGPSRPMYPSSSLPKTSKTKAASFKASAGKFTVKRTEQKLYDTLQRVENLRRTIEMRLETKLPDDAMEALADGVTLCNLVNRIQPKTVTTIYTPPKGSKLSRGKAQMNISAFVDGCRRLGVPVKMLCSIGDVLQQRDPSRLCQTVESLIGLVDKETEI